MHQKWSRSGHKRGRGGQRATQLAPTQSAPTQLAPTVLANGCKNSAKSRSKRESRRRSRVPIPICQIFRELSCPRVTVLTFATVRIAADDGATPLQRRRA